MTGQLPVPSEFDRRLLEKLHRDMGPAIASALADDRTVEVMLNPDGVVWQERLGEGMCRIGTLAAARAQAVIQTVAAHLGTQVTRQCPALEGELPPDGARFAGQIPPIVAAAAFSIRKPAVHRLSLADYVSCGSMTEAQRCLLNSAVAEHRNILVSGGTGSGKTTLVNALIAQMVTACPGERLVILEDTRELDVAAENHVRFRSTQHVSMTQLLRTTLRMRPDRVLVGEVRGPEALDLLMAWNTGHEGGAATLHANSARSALQRLCMLVSMHPQAPRDIEPLVADAVDVVVHIARTATGRAVREVLDVRAQDPSSLLKTH